MKIFYAVQATVSVIENINQKFSKTINNWFNQPNPKAVELKYSTEEIISIVMQQAEWLKHKF